MTITDTIRACCDYLTRLEDRQAQLRLEELRNQIRIDVRNAEYALEEAGSRVDAARKARDLAQRTFEITQKEQASAPVRLFRH